MATATKTKNGNGHSPATLDDLESITAVGPRREATVTISLG